ncbi:MAG: glycosyltransferase family 4 protein [Candidatus Vecturithrix sp.]|jgi:glycosyltransferase involved in cell wall biosynthesis|nr:glycosyltransferase family 4 protein [Candidatus Vecturithrix sp.]
MDHKESYLFILPWPLTSLGGVNQVVENLYKQIKLNGRYVPLILVNSWDDTRIRRENLNGIDHYFLRIRSPWETNSRISGLLKYALWFYSSRRTLVNFLQENNVSAINIHYCSLYALFFCILKNFRANKWSFIISFHGQDLLQAKMSRGLERKLWWRLLSCADRIVTCSESLKKELVDFSRNCADKVKVIHNGIDCATRVDMVRDDKNTIYNKRYIINVATLEHKKGQDVLLKAFKKISDEYKDLNLVLIGRPGDSSVEIKKLIKSIGLASRIFLYESVEHVQVMEFIKGAEIFVLPSRYEPFGIVILEAGLYEVPVIASNVGGVSEIITHNETGRLCNPDDIDSLVSELRSLLSNPGDRTRLGKNLRKHVVSNFSWDCAYQRYLECV